jgi:hypothetical protein
VGHRPAGQAQPDLVAPLVACAAGRIRILLDVVRPFSRPVSSRPNAAEGATIAPRRLLAVAELARVAVTVLVTLCAALSLGACDRTPEAVANLTITQFRHERAQGVLLNEPLVVHFSRPLDPRSLTRASFSVTDVDGRRARGTVRVVGRRLEFEPELSRSHELADGGFLPSQRYTLRLAGYPRVDALRGRDGAPLERSIEYAFETAPADGMPFLDEAPERGARLTIEDSSVGAGEPWHLFCDKAIDPRSVSNERFVLVPSRIDSQRNELQEGGAQDSGTSPQDTEQVGERRVARPEFVELRARLVENRPEFARIELMPRDTSGLPQLLAVGAYSLIEVASLGVPLRDLGGTPIESAFRNLAFAVPLLVENAAPLVLGRRLIETFASDDLASPRSVDGSIGQARWEGDGRVRLLLPRAAGTGQDGIVELTETGERTRFEATDLSIPEGASVEFGATGPVILAAQGRITISGRLIRRVQTGEARQAPDEGHAAWLRRLRFDEGTLDVPWLAFEERETLTRFLERAGREQLPVTCLVCGGDLVVDGDIDVDGPLILVAGGRVRIPGRVRASEARITKPFGRSAVDAWIYDLPLEIDEPTQNPLVREQRWSIVSGPLMPGSDFRHWSAARAAGRPEPGTDDGPPGNRFEVAFIGVGTDDQGRLVDLEPVSDLRLLEDTTVVRLRIDLVVAPARPGFPITWDPPWVDEIELVWE